MGALETALERASNAAPNPGRPTVHRLNRTEYTNSVRDLLALEIDGRSLLPADDTDAHGFDNNADVLTVSPVARRPVPLGGAQDQPPRGRTLDRHDHRDVSAAAPAGPGRASRRAPPVRIARRHRHRALLPGRRRVRGQDPAADQQLQLHQGSRRPARSRGAPRSRGGQGLHRRRHEGRRAAGELGRHAVRQHRVGEVRAADARRPRGAIARQGRAARSRASRSSASRGKPKTCSSRGRAAGRCRATRCSTRTRAWTR